MRLDHRIPPLALVAVFAAAIVLACAHVPLVRIPLPGQRALAIVLGTLGLVVISLGAVEFRRARTTVNPLAPGRASALVCSGVYRFSRNPMYLGCAVILLGVAAWDSALAGYVLVAAFCAYMNRFQIVPEERALLANFGEEFVRYRTKVRRWL